MKFVTGTYLRGKPLLTRKETTFIQMDIVFHYWFGKGYTMTRNCFVISLFIILFIFNVSIVLGISRDSGFIVIVVVIAIVLLLLLL